MEFVPFVDGLQVVPEGREIGFGRDWAGVEATVSRFYGAPDARAACGREITVAWGDLVLRHDGHRFVGVGCVAS